jgi:hypothetical protein
MTRYYDIYPTNDATDTEVVNELVFTSKQISSTLLPAALVGLLATIVVVVLVVARGRQRVATTTSDLTVTTTTINHPTTPPQDLWLHVKLLLHLNVGLLLILALHRYGDWLSSSDWLAQVPLLLFTNWRSVASAAFLLLLLAQVPAAGALLALIVALSAVKIAAVSFVALTLADVLLLYALIDARQQTHFLALVTLNWALLIAGFNHWFGLFTYQP